MVCFDRTKGWKEAGSLIVQGFFMPINYRGSAVEHPQISCHFSLPTIWGARNSVGRSAIPLVSVEYIFFCARSMMRTYHETSHIVVSFPGFPHQIPCSGSAHRGALHHGWRGRRQDKAGSRGLRGGGSQGLGRRVRPKCRVTARDSEGRSEAARHPLKLGLYRRPATHSV